MQIEEFKKIVQRKFPTAMMGAIAVDNSIGIKYKFDFKCSKGDYEYESKVFNLNTLTEERLEENTSNVSASLNQTFGYVTYE